jgi:hypothetical protein
MDNDTLINQARHLYAVLEVEQHTRSRNSKAQFDRLERLVIWAYCRYQRRLNRCAICYENRLRDCNREIEGDVPRFCPNCCKRSPMVRSAIKRK